MNTTETIKNKISKYIPFAYEFSGINKNTLEKKIKVLEKRVLELTKKDNSENEIYRPHCIFDLLFLADNDELDNIRFKSFLFHFDNIVKELVQNERIKTSLHSKIKDSVKQVILSIDEKVGNNFQYLNFYGELFGLHSILKKNPKLELIDIERPLPNGKKVDCVFKVSEIIEPIYIDFVSFHNIKIELLADSNEFNSFFRSKYERKIESKTENLESEGIYLKINSEKIPFKILPIIWEDIKPFMIFKEQILQMDNNLENVYELSSLLVQEDNNHQINYDFTSVSNILEIMETENK